MAFTCTARPLRSTRRPLVYTPSRSRPATLPATPPPSSGPTRWFTTSTASSRRSPPADRRDGQSRGRRPGEVLARRLPGSGCLRLAAGVEARLPLAVVGFLARARDAELQDLGRPLRLSLEDRSVMGRFLPGTSRRPGRRNPEAGERSLPVALGDVRPQHVPCKQEAALDELLVALEATILMLDREHVVVADGVQGGDEATPLHLAEAGEPRHLPADPAGEGPVAVEPVAPHLEVLRMGVEDPVGIVVDGPLVVDHQPDEVRGVDVEPEVLRRDRGEHLVPDRRGPGEVVAARPFVVAEDHRAVLDCDLDPALTGVVDERGPDLPEALEVLRERPVLVVPDERPDDLDAEPLCSVDHLEEVSVDFFTVRVVGMKVVGVVGQ